VASSLHGVRVLITRAPDQEDALGALFEQRGARVRHAPVLRIGPPPDEAALTRAAERADDYEWLVFASANGVQAFAARRRAKSQPTARVAAVGPATAAAAKECLGVSDVLVPAQYVAESLAHAIVEAAPGGSRILLVQAADARPALAAILRAAGMHLTAVAAYTTVSMPPLDLPLRVKDCDVITLTSASAVRALVEGLGGDGPASLQLRGKLIACIGPVSEQEARNHGLHVELSPAQPGFEALVDAVCAYYAHAQP